MGRSAVELTFRFLAASLVACLGAASMSDAGEWEWAAGRSWTRDAGAPYANAKGHIRLAYELEQRGEYLDSARQYYSLLRHFPDSREAGVALQRLARCLYMMGDYWTAYEAVEQVIATYSESGRLPDLIEVELRIAKKLMPSPSPVVGDGSPARDDNAGRALRILDSVLGRDPREPVAAEAYVVKGEGHLLLNEPAEARSAFETILGEFPRSDFVERARLGILRCDSLAAGTRPTAVERQAVHSMIQDGGSTRHPARKTENGASYRDLAKSFEGLVAVQAVKMLELADQYAEKDTAESRQAARLLYLEIIRRYPWSPQAEEAKNRLGPEALPESRHPNAADFPEVRIERPLHDGMEPEPPWTVPGLDREAPEAGAG